MKKTFLVKAIPAIVGSSILALFLVPTGYAYIAGFSDSNSTSVTSCNSEPGSFPVFPFAKLKTNANGFASVVEVYLSSVNGACSEKIYSSHEFGYSSVPDSPLNRNETTVTLKQ